MRRSGGMLDERAVVMVSCDAASVGPARTFVRRPLESADEPTIGSEQIDDIVLVASELVTNAVEHGTGGDVEVSVDISNSYVTLSVAASSDGLPRPAHGVPSADALRGRGLFIVGALCEDVTFERSGDSNRITCAFPIG